jgi:hypothetical protein
MPPYARHWEAGRIGKEKQYLKKLSYAGNKPTAPAPTYRDGKSPALTGGLSPTIRQPSN